MNIAIKLGGFVFKERLEPTVLKSFAAVLRQLHEKGHRLVVVAGGGGLSSAEDFKQLEELANVLKGAVGATRIPCEQGWVSSSIQIGQTGKIVTPDLYIAVAISGALQHIAGCLGSKYIVTINTDPESNMLKVSNFGVVGDYKVALPALIAKCKELLK